MGITERRRLITPVARLAKQLAERIKEAVAQAFPFDKDPIFIEFWQQVVGIEGDCLSQLTRVATSLEKGDHITPIGRGWIPLHATVIN